MNEVFQLKWVIRFHRPLDQFHFNSPKPYLCRRKMEELEKKWVILYKRTAKSWPTPKGLVRSVLLD